MTLYAHSTCHVYIQKQENSSHPVKEVEEEEEGMAQDHQETRKGPWTVQEDKALACFVGLFGDRRWDFIAKVSGLNRAGKSCRLRWVNYLQPGLKRGKLSPQEERLVIELHSKCGNRWSRIAKKLPGRTDNEIKNYWRTHVRKKAQEMRKRDRVVSLSSSSYSPCDSSSTLSSVTTDPSMSPLTDLQSIKSDCDHQRGKSINMEDADGGSSDQPFVGGLQEDGKEEEACKAYSMDQIWKEIAPYEMMNGVIPDENFRFDGGTNCPSPPMLAMASPLWDYQYEDQGWVFNIES